MKSDVVGPAQQARCVLSSRLSRQRVPSASHAAPHARPSAFPQPRLQRGALTVLVQFFATFGLFFVGMQYLQLVVGHTALGAAIALLPLPLVMIPLARNAPRMARRFDFGRIALLLTATGLAVISQVSEALNHVRFATGLVLFAVGIALAGPSATTAITETLPERKRASPRRSTTPPRWPSRIRARSRGSGQTGRDSSQQRSTPSCTGSQVRCCWRPASSPSPPWSSLNAVAAMHGVYAGRTG
jgi:hypothetical protein